jgi:hypothetical protein
MSKIYLFLSNCFTGFTLSAIFAINGKHNEAIAFLNALIIIFYSVIPSVYGAILLVSIDKQNKKLTKNLLSIFNSKYLICWFFFISFLIGLLTFLKANQVELYG